MVGIPTLSNAGAATVAAMTYAAVEGRPIPRIIQAIMDIKSIRKIFPLDSWKTIWANRTPNPVMLTIPITIPAEAQAMVTGMHDLVACKTTFFNSIHGNLFSNRYVRTIPISKIEVMANIAE
jgi:hypothetical protein